MERFRMFVAPTIPELVVLLNSLNLGLGRVIYLGVNDNALAVEDRMLAVIDMAFVPVITHEDYLYLNQQKEVDFELDPEFPITLSA
jgi:hypothetical protein